MTHEYTEEREFITLYDDEGNESLYEILMTIDGEEQFGKNYVLLYPSGAADEDEVELQAYAYEEDENGGEGKLLPIESDEEWDMVEEVLNTFLLEEEEE